MLVVACPSFPATKYAANTHASSSATFHVMAFPLWRGAATASRVSARRKRSQVCRECNDLVLRQLRDYSLHQRRIGTRARAVLQGDQLPRDVDRLKAREARHLSEAGQLLAVADVALNRLAAAALGERLAFLDAAGRHVGDEPRMRVANRDLHRVLRTLDDAAP